MRFAKDVTELIGATPLVRLNRIARDVGAQIYAKLESRNPANSVKDRIGLAMLEEAERRGVLRHGKTVIVEPTSGNTGIALALVAAVKGYPCVLVMPDNYSPERRVTLRAFGARLVLTPAAQGMRGAVERARQIRDELPDAYMPQQFDNPANPRVHEQTTGREIWDDTDGSVDALVAGVGTGGTLTGVARHIKPRRASFEAIAVEPLASPVLSEGRAGGHRIQGLGAGFVPAVLDTALVDRVIRVSDEEALATSRQLAREEGILAGISAGANVAAALRYAEEPENRGKLVVTIVPDFGERYVQTLLFQPYRYEGSDELPAAKASRSHVSAV
jgi:cysteine synthase A